MTFKYGCEGPQSMTCEPEVDKLIADASMTPAGPERIQKWQHLFKVLYEDYMPEVWLYHMVVYARVWDGARYTERKKLCESIRDERGRILPEREIEAQDFGDGIGG